MNRGSQTRGAQNRKNQAVNRGKWAEILQGLVQSAEPARFEKQHQDAGEQSRDTAAAAAAADMLDHSGPGCAFRQQPSLGAVPAALTEALHVGLECTSANGTRGKWHPPRLRRSLSALSKAAGQGRLCGLGGSWRVEGHQREDREVGLLGESWA